MVVFSKSLVDVKIHKKRVYKKNYRNLIKFGDYAFINLKETKIELIQLSFIKKLFKKIIKRKKKKKSNNIIQKNYKIWVNLIPNYVISRKSKNSRMGKGKGSFERWVIRLKQGFILSEFIGISKYRLTQVLIKFNKKFNMKLCLVSNIKCNTTFPVWSKLNVSLEYFNKFRFM